MGYFKRRVDRGRARRTVRAMHDAGGESRAWEAIPKSPARGRRFIRFSTRVVHEDSGRREGIFASTYRVYRDPSTDPNLVAILRDHLVWFGVNLTSPYMFEPRAIFLFKTDATQFMEHVWSLAFALREAGVWVEMQTFERPGRIVYEDEHQVAVIPWADELAL